MVDFKTRIFTESDNDIIGAEVIVFSDQGTRIGSIEIANAEDLNALREELEVIDETYFDETRLNAVLANSQESTTINATSISGYSSSDLAKVSQLSGYALTNHTHVKTSITDLYNYSISCSNYNPTIDTDISVTVKVTNQAGNPVVGHTVSILKNNSSWKSGTTGSNGEFTTTYTCSEWGLITFSANTTSKQVNVTGRKQMLNNITYSLWVDESTRTAVVLANRTNVTIGVGDGFNYNDFKIPSNYRPTTNSFVTIGRTTPGIINYIWTDGTVGIYNNGSQITNYTLNFRHEYHF